ncbi:MAG: TIGR04002 family protein, partial [Parasporobacterium sp.]|nr:TIGR04002 family protein [Parasporobacterium sp.]
MEITMNREKIRTLTLTGVFTALILVLTAFVHIPSYTGYVHVGDAFIFLAAALLPAPYAVFAGAAGAVLSDVLTGYAMWAPASFVIKTLIVLFFSRKEKKLITKRNMLALIPSVLLTVGGYYLYEGIISGNFAAPVYGILGNVIQAVFSAALFVVIGIALDKLRIT